MHSLLAIANRLRLALIQPGLRKKWSDISAELLQVHIVLLADHFLISCQKKEFTSALHQGGRAHPNTFAAQVKGPRCISDEI